MNNRTASGTFHDGDLLLNQKGLRLKSEEKEPRVSFFLIFITIFACTIYVYYRLLIMGNFDLIRLIDLVILYQFTHCKIFIFCGRLIRTTIISAAEKKDKKSIYVRVYFFSLIELIYEQFFRVQTLVFNSPYLGDVTTLIQS